MVGVVVRVVGLLGRQGRGATARSSQPRGPPTHPTNPPTHPPTDEVVARNRWAALLVALGVPLFNSEGRGKGKGKGKDGAPKDLANKKERDDFMQALLPRLYQRGGEMYAMVHAPQKL